MHIIEIIIDGFKSYAGVTHIKGFDSQFNAVTGANGSGKSNILDAIWFVFGIQSLRLVRASNLKELIYKQGTAKVKDARVTIVFDNSNKNLSPPNYSSNDKIEVTREITNMEKSKYRINGKNQTAEKVKSLFLSVHLNVNNPHFLVMQGKITQVVKMKPKQILSLIEETSGTALFEKRKEEWLKNMERKDLTLRHITETIETQIEPMRSKIAESRENTRKYGDNEKQIEDLDRDIWFDEYVNLLFGIHNLEGENEHEDENVQEEAKVISEYKWEVDQLNLELKSLSTENVKEGNQVGELLASLNHKEKLINESEQVVRENNIFIEKNSDKVAELEGKIQSESHVIEKCKNQKYTLAEKQSSLAGEILKANNDLSKLNSQLQDSSSSKKEDKEDYRKQLKNKIDDAQSNIDRIEKEIHQQKSDKNSEKIEAEILQLEADLSKCDQTVKQNKKRHEDQFEEIEGLKSKIKSLHSTKDKINQIVANKESCEDNKKKIKMSLYSNPEMNRISNILQLNYRCPQGFDKEQVYGRLVNLFSPKSSKHVLSLEVIGGSQLFSVIVTNRHVSTRLLKEKWFPHFVAFIPLKEIQFHSYPSDLIKKLETKYDGKVVHALKTLDYSPNVERAMRFVFGNYFICENSQIAKAMIQEANIQWVTLEGDIFRSSGVISGGYMGNLPKNIELVQAYKHKSRDINNINISLSNLEEEYKVCMREEAKLNELRERLTDKENEIKSLVLDSTQQKKSIKNM